MFLPHNHNRFFLEEKTAGGAGKAFFASTTPCIVLRSKAQGPLLWALGNRKIGDGAILTYSAEKYHLHLLEMKSKLTQGEWAKALDQFEGMHLAAVAAVRLLGIVHVDSVTCYIAYKEDAMGASDSADMIFMKTFIGIANPVGGNDSWVSKSVALPITGPAMLKQGQRDQNSDVDFGLIS